MKINFVLSAVFLFMLTLAGCTQSDILAPMPTPQPTPTPVPAPNPSDVFTWEQPGGYQKGAPFTMLLHVDVLSKLHMGPDFAKSEGLHFSLPTAIEGKVGGFAAVLWAPAFFQGEAKNRYCREAPMLLEAILQNHSDQVRIAKTPKDFLANWKSGRLSLFRTVEGATCLGNDLSAIDKLYEQGVRMIGPTWKNNQTFATSWISKSDVGLTDLGKKAVTRMNELGIAVDVSHMSDAAFRDTVTLSSAPIVASHSNCRTLCNVPRNLTDQQIEAICKGGGVIGVNFYPRHLNGKMNAGISDILLHIDHLKKIGGIDCIALGSDFDGIKIPPTDLKSAAQMPELNRAMLESGYPKQDVTKIFGGNFIRTLAKIQKK